MPERRPFAYTILRLVPSIERGEQLNVGVVVFCRQARFLAARTELDESRIRALAPGLELESVRVALDAVCAVLEGDPAAGPLAELDQSDRFGWVAARSSTALQASEAHTGVTADPAATLDRLFAQLVAI